jgi:hypothetical protein
MNIKLAREKEQKYRVRVFSGDPEAHFNLKLNHRDDILLYSMGLANRKLSK